MDCIQAQQLIKPYLDGYLSDRELEEFLDHVQTCPDCFDELEVYFSVFRTLNDVDEKGDYNFRKKLRHRLEGSRAYLVRRKQSKALKASLIFAAEFALVMAFWGLFTQDYGFLNGLQTQTVYETEADTAAQQSSNAAQAEDEAAARQTEKDTDREADEQTDKETEQYE